MSVAVDPLIDPARVRDDYVPKEGYFDQRFAMLELEHLWSKVWQVACRAEEIPNVGDYVTYDIGRDSITVVRRSEDEIRAFFNSCQHRGRRLTEGCGKMKRFQCRFHGWKYNLDGKCIEVLDRKDWADRLDDADVNLIPVSVDTWGGFVFINMDPNPEPLAEYLRPINELLANFELEKMRFRWYKTARLKCNWKTVLEAFDEGYHAAQTHPQLLPYFDDYTGSRALGRHGAFFYPEMYPPLQQSRRLKKEPPKDYRKIVMDYTAAFNRDLAAMVTPRSYEAAQRLKDEVAEGATPDEVLTKWATWTVEAAEKEGAGWPPVTPEDVRNLPADIHLFPNSVFLAGNVDGMLWYRARPDGTNPESCLFDVWSLVRYAPGAEPPLDREFYDNWQDHENWGLVLTQDFRNIEEVQRGMAVRSFRAARTNPVQEVAVSHFERTVREYLSSGAAARPE
jgi:phenylpropionate dioxygenase-like ring-hydroxylating dioxygenase large terminal subunit